MRGRRCVGCYVRRTGYFAGARESKPFLPTLVLGRPVLCSGVSSMKWMLVVLVGGITPVQTDVLFEKLSDCLAAEEQLRKAYTDALDAWDKRAALTFERRRDYVRARDLQARKLDNSGTCIPHTGGGQPIASSKVSDQPASTSPTPSAVPAR